MQCATGGNKLFVISNQHCTVSVITPWHNICGPQVCTYACIIQILGFCTWLLREQGMPEFPVWEWLKYLTPYSCVVLRVSYHISNETSI